MNNLHTAVTAHLGRVQACWCQCAHGSALSQHNPGVWGHQLWQIQQDLNSTGCISLWGNFKHHLFTWLFVSLECCFLDVISLPKPTETNRSCDRNPHRKGLRVTHLSHNPTLGVLKSHSHCKSPRTDWAVTQWPFRNYWTQGFTGHRFWEGAVAHFSQWESCAVFLSFQTPRNVKVSNWKAGKE